MCAPGSSAFHPWAGKVHSTNCLLAAASSPAPVQKLLLRPNASHSLHAPGFHCTSFSLCNLFTFPFFFPCSCLPHSLFFQKPTPGASRSGESFPPQQHLLHLGVAVLATHTAPGFLGCFCNAHTASRDPTARLLSMLICPAGVAMTHTCLLSLQDAPGTG